MNKLSASLAFFLLNVYISGAQILVKANDPSIRYDLIKPAHTFHKLTAYDSTGVIIDQYVNEGYVKVDSVHHQISFSRFAQVPAGQFNFDTSVMNAAGPVSMHEYEYPRQQEQSMTFTKTSVDAHVFANNVRSDKSTAIHEGYFDDNIIQDIIGYIPFKKGLKYHLDCYRYESKGQIDPFDIEYVFDDFLLQADGALRECAVLAYTTGFSKGYCWIDKDTHANLKEIIQIGKVTYLIVKA